MKFPIKFLVALLALVLGITGVLVCVIPHYGPEKVVYDFVAAVEKGDAEKIADCYASSLLSELDGAAEEMMGKVSANLAQRMLDIPQESKVESIQILGCSVEEGKEILDSCKVVALIEGEYVDAEGATQTTVVSRNFAIVKTKKGYKIYG